MLMTIEEAKRRLPLNELAKRLGISARIPERDSQTVQCFWPDRHQNGDRNPSFNFYEGLTRFMCFACGAQGDGPDLIASCLGLSADEAINRFVAMAGGNPEVCRPAGKPKRLTLPSDFRKGGEDEWKKLAKLRLLNMDAVNLAVEMGVLGFGQVCNEHSWILTDKAGLLAEGRRMDGEQYAEVGSLPARKAHTLPCSKKSWPVGLLPEHSNVAAFRTILVCEGGPDLLAAYHFCLRYGVLGALPVSMLGRSVSGIHSEALKYFKGKRVRIFPHADADGGGLEAAKKWKSQIEGAGASKVDAFDFSGLVRRDGKPVNDLNDCAVIRPEDETELEGLLP